MAEPARTPAVGAAPPDPRDRPAAVTGRRRPARYASTLVLVAALVTGGCTGADQAPAETPPATAASRSQTSSSAPDTTPGSLADVPAVAGRLQPSVVTISVPGGSGSGVVYTEDGLILTNEHVVRGHRDVSVAFADGQQVAGRVTAVDRVSDLALVQADRTGLPPAPFDTALPAVGSLAVVIGSPLGFENTVTAGVVSGLHREIPGSATRSQALIDLIQTDAPISPGNSGGAVADADGEVIGISEAYIPPQAGAVSLGFAIPAATAVHVAEQLRRTGRVRHAFAGLVPGAITSRLAEQLGIERTDGFLVTAVVGGGPAENAGLRPGDVVTAADGRPTPTPEDFLAILRAHAPGDTLRVTVATPGRDVREVTLTLTDRPR